MKRCLTILLCLTLLMSCASALAEGADIRAVWMPAEVLEFFSSSSLSGYTVGESASFLLENTAGGTFFFAVAQKDGHNVLYGFEEKNGKFQYWMKTDNCLPQGEGFFRVQFSSGYLEMLDLRPLDLGECLDILFTRAGNEEQGDTELFFAVGKNGQFNLKLLSYDSLWSEALFTDDSIAYYHEGEYLGTAYGTVERNLRYFSLSAFPRTVREARQKLTQAPAIPSGELQAQKIKFSGGQKYPVYSGPGAEYERAAGGKASVSTNDWIQVFGSENGYILIQYAISSSQMRFGYIEQAALPKSATVSALQLDWADAQITASTFLTDDPLNSQTHTRALASGQQVKWLAIMGNWVYVETDGTGQPIRGFVPASAVTRAQAQAAYSASYRNGVYTAQADVKILYGATAEISVTVDGPAEWNHTGADQITGYQLYANNVPVKALSTVFRDLTVTGWQSVFSLSASIPGGTAVIGLCPVHDQSGQQAGEMMVIVLDSASRQNAPAVSVSDGAWPYEGYNVAVVNNPDARDRLHLRKNAYGSADSLGKYYNGTVVNVLPDTRENAEWAHVRIGGTEGYMEAKYLAFGDAGRQVVSAHPLVTVDNQAGTGLNLRAGQSIDSEVIRLLENGTQVTVLGLSEDWLHVQAGNETGYIRITGTSPRIPYTYGTPGGANAKITSRVAQAALYKEFTDEFWDGGNPAAPAALYLKAGAQVTVTGVRGDYSQVQYQGKSYWISSSDLDPIGD